MKNAHHVKDEAGAPDQGGPIVASAGRKPRRKTVKPLALVAMHDSKPTVTTPRIAELFGRRHFDVMKTIGKLVSAAQINERQLACIEWVDSKGRKQPGYRLSERDALVLMPFLGGDRAMEGQAHLVDAFERARSQLARLTSSDPSWRQQRRDAAADATAMCETLELVRLKAGKQTLPHHFINEHRLVAHALTGAVAPLLDRSRLDADTLGLVAEVQRLNRKLMRHGTPYAARKAQCRALAESRMAPGRAAPALDAATGGGGATA